MNTTDFYQSCIADRWQMKQLWLQTSPKTSKLVQFDSLCRNMRPATWQRSAGCFGEQRKGGGEDRAESSFLELNFVADVLWSQASKQGRRSQSTEQADQIQHPRCLCGRWALMLLEASQARAFHDFPSPSYSWNGCLIAGFLVVQTRK